MRGFHLKGGDIGVISFAIRLSFWATAASVNSSCAPRGLVIEGGRAAGWRPPSRPHRGGGALVEAGLRHRQACGLRRPCDRSGGRAPPQV